jgi:O-antigen chain-terminating methyltransferase
VTDELKREMTRAAERLHDRSVPPTIQIPTSDETTVGVKLFEAYQHSRLDHLEAGPPLSSVKRLMRRLLRSLLGRQSSYNQAMADAVSELNHQLMLTRRELAAIVATLDQQRRSATVHLASLETQIDDIRHDSLATLSLQVTELATSVADQRDQRRDVDLQTYEAFDDAFRAPQSSIADRLRPYLDDLADLKGGTAPVADLGSGKGEWLRILREAEIPAVGFDTNERVAEETRGDGLNIVVGDAVELLAAQAPHSLGAVTAFQLVERLTVRDISSLIEAAFVALAPGGALILETPNASNLRVGASSFYRDPTHVRPVHPDWLSFLVAHHGFVGVETRFLHPSAEYDEFAAGSRSEGMSVAEPLLADLRWALYGPQDFAVVARKPRSPTG